MRAMVLTAFGGPENFHLQDVPKPTPGRGEVLVRVHATSVNPVDYKIRKDGTWAGVRPPAILGYDVSGVVEGLGPGVRDFRTGDEVYYTPEIRGAAGSYAEYHVAHESIVARKPENLSHIEAAAVPLAASTAYDALVTRAHVQVGETVLVHAASGGVGHFAVQIARAAGARVLGTCRTASADFVRNLGADVAIDYRSEDVVARARELTAGFGADLTLDTVGGETLSKSVDATRPHGRIVSIVGAPANLSGAGRRNLDVHFLFLERGRSKLDVLRSLCERGLMRPAVDTELPLEEVATAHGRLEAGGVRGKIVLRVT